MTRFIVSGRSSIFARLALAAALSFTLAGQTIITTIAGTDKSLPVNGVPGTALNLLPYGSGTVDSAGNYYFVDGSVDKVLRLGTDGTITAVAGNGIRAYSGDGGSALNASLDTPFGVAADMAGNLYIADSNNQRIRKVTAAGVILTIGGNGLEGESGDGGPAINATLGTPFGIAVDTSGNVYFTEADGNRLRKISASGVISTLTASLNQPYGVTVDPSGNVYVADAGNTRVVRIAVSGAVSTIQVPASFNLTYPTGVALDNSGNLYITDYGWSDVLKVTPAGAVSLVAGATMGFSGDGGPAASAGLNLPYSASPDATGDLFILDFNNARIRKVSPSLIITTVAGNTSAATVGDGGPATLAFLDHPVHAVTDPAGNVYIADLFNYRVRKVSIKGLITTVAGNGTAGYAGDGGSATSASLFDPWDIAVDNAGNLYIADPVDAVIRKVSSTGIISTIAGSPDGDGCQASQGPATAPLLLNPVGVAVDSAQNVYVADNDCNVVWKVSSGGFISVIAGVPGFSGYGGDEGPATNALLSAPTSVALDAMGNLYIADAGNSLIRRVNPLGTIETVAGVPKQAGYGGDGGRAISALLNMPQGVATDTAGNIYVADSFNLRVRMINAQGIISTIAGTGQNAFSGDGGPAMRAAVAPSGVYIDSAGDVIIADQPNNRVRAILSIAPAYQVSPASLSFQAVSNGQVTSAQTLQLTSAVAGLPFSISKNSSWLQVSPASGVLPATVQVSIDPTGSAAGNPSTALVISVPGATPAALTVNVTANIANAANPVISLDRQSLTFSALQGSPAQTAQISIGNSGSGQFSAIATATTDSAPGWLSVTPANAVVAANTPATLFVTASPGSLAPGTYTGKIAVSNADGSQTKTAMVIMAVNPSAAILTLSQTGLTFRAVAQGGSPLPQTVTILNTGSGQMPWTAQAKILSGSSSWLSLSAASGTVQNPTSPSTLTVTANPSGLPQGDYYASVEIAAPGSNSPSQLLTVLMSVLPPGSTLPPEVQPSALVFVGSAAAPPGSQDVLVSNRAGGQLSFVTSKTTSDGANWIAYTPSTGTVQPNVPGKVTIQTDFSVAPAGVTTGSVNFVFSDGSVQAVHVLSVNNSATASAVRGHANSSCAITLLSLNDASPLAAVVGQPTKLQVSATQCGQPISSTSIVSAAFSTGQNGQPFSYTQQNGIWETTWVPQSATTSPLTITVTALSIAASGGSAGSQIYVTANVASSSSPLFTSITNAASLEANVPVTPGGLITIFGANMSNSGGVPATAVPLPIDLNGATVYMNDEQLPILYSSPTQLNVQVPYALPLDKAVSFTVQHAGAQMTAPPIQVASSLPAVFTVNASGSGQGAITSSNYVLADANNPAKRGDTIIIYCTGLGQVTPAVLEGTPAPSNPPATTIAVPTVTIGGEQAPVVFHGLSPGSTGLYQINAVLPTDATTGNAVPVIVYVNNVASPAVTMSVQ